MPKEGSFPIPLKYVDVVRRTSTTIGCIAGKSNWRQLERWWWQGAISVIDRFRPCSQHWAKSLLMVTRGSGEIDKGGGNIQARLSMAIKFGRICRKKYRQKAKRHWTLKKSKFDNAQTWTGIYHIDPNDMKFKDTMKNARKKLEVPLGSAMPCESSNQQGAALCAHNKSRKSRFACIVGAHESTRTRTGTSQPRDHDDRITDKGFNSLSHYNLVHKPISPPPSNENPGCESRSWQRMGKARKFSSMASDEIQQQKRGVIEKAQKEERSVHFATLIDSCHFKNSNLEQKFPRYMGRVVLRGDGAKDDSGSYAVCLQSRVRQHH